MLLLSLITSCCCCSPSFNKLLLLLLLAFRCCCTPGCCGFLLLLLVHRGFLSRTIRGVHNRRLSFCATLCRNCSTSSLGAVKTDSLVQIHPSVSVLLIRSCCFNAPPSSFMVVSTVPLCFFGKILLFVAEEEQENFFPPDQVDRKMLEESIAALEAAVWTGVTQQLVVVPRKNESSECTVSRLNFRSVKRAPRPWLLFCSCCCCLP